MAATRTQRTAQCAGVQMAGAVPCVVTLTGAHLVSDGVCWSNPNSVLAMLLLLPIIDDHMPLDTKFVIRLLQTLSTWVTYCSHLL
jgi:hypothetical protein